MAEEIDSLADKIISILKQKKIVELSDLVKETGAEEKDIKLIINLLEKEGMVDIGYSLTKVLISWNDEADRVLMNVRKNQSIIHHSQAPSDVSINTHYKNTEPHKSEQNLDGEPSFNIFREESSQKVEEEIKKIKSNILQKGNKQKKEKAKDVVRESSYQVGGMAVKDRETIETDDYENDGEDFAILNSKVENILRKNENEIAEEKREKRSKKQKDTEIEKEIAEIERNILLRISGEDEEGDSAHIISLKDSDIVKEGSKQNPKKIKESTRQVLKKYKADHEVESNDIYKELRKKLDEINQKKEEISELNKQKTILFDSQHPEIKSRLSAQIQAIEKLMDEKESRLKELRNKIDQLPIDLDETARNLSNLKKKSDDLNSSFSQIINQIKDTRDQLKEIKAEYISELDLIRNQIIEQEKEIIRIGNIYSSLKEKEGRLLNSISFVKENILKSQQELLNLEEQLDRFNAISKSIEMKLDDTNKVLKSLNRQFDTCVNRLKEIESFDKDLKELEYEYLKKKEEIDSKIREYEKDLVSLSKSIELEATSRYLKEIEDMLAESENSISVLYSSEKELNRKIEEKKAELNSLLHEARQLRDSIYSQESTGEYFANNPENNLDKNLVYNSKSEFEEKRIETSELNKMKSESNFLKSSIFKAKEKISELISKFKKK
ncbi:MAG: hypothetical protein NZ903_00160 [Candidatus Micrarchaeota archaeon]|nr:hypothetical protein [Candidatus Micrarchaeota archaeon]